MRRTLFSLLAVLVLVAFPVGAQIQFGGNLPDSASACYDSIGKVMPLQFGVNAVTVPSGTTFTLADGSTLVAAETMTFTLGATEYFSVDASSTAHTETSGAVRFTLSSSTADANLLNLALTVPNGTSSGVNVYVGKVVLTANDADADVDGVLWSAAATTNAAAGSYEFFESYDCAENTIGACTAGLVFASSGTAGGMTSAIDASAANITNSLSTGSNPILGDNSDSFTIGATDATFTVIRNDAGVVTYNCADNNANADCVFAAGGTGISTLGSATSASAAITTDGTGTGELVVPNDSISLTTETDGNYVASVATSSATGLTGGAAGSEGTAISLAFDYTATVGADPALAANTCVFGVNGLVCEGATADGFEYFFTLPDPGADVTATFPTAAGTIVGSGDTGTVTGTMIGNDAVDGADLADSVTMDGNQAFIGDYDFIVATANVSEAGLEAASGNVSKINCVGGICQAKLTFTDVPVSILNTTGPGHNCFGGVKIYDFPLGWINRLGVVASFTSITFGAGGLADDSDGDVGFGSVTAVEDGGLAGTEVDWVPSTELTQAVGGVVPAELATSTVTEQTLCDGSSAACDLFMNFEFDDADCSAADTLAVTGYAIVSWINLGDN